MARSLSLPWLLQLPPPPRPRCGSYFNRERENIFLFLLRQMWNYSPLETSRSTPLKLMPLSQLKDRNLQINKMPFLLFVITSKLLHISTALQGKSKGRRSPPKVLLFSAQWLGSAYVETVNKYASLPTAETR